jgi:hypothetical protein
MRLLPSMLILILTAALSGCAAPRASSETDALARLMRPADGKAVIYVFRNEPASAPWGISVSLDGKDMGKTGAETYFRWAVDPGQHIIVSQSEHASELVVQVEAGRVYYVWQEVRMGILRPRTVLKEVDRSTADIALRTCHLLTNPS